MVHLHLHTKYSLLDGMIDVGDLIVKLKELGHTSVAITDHGVMYGNCEAFKKCQENNIKLIIGCECYICEDAEIKNKESVTSHLILLAKNEQGRLNLQKIVGESTLHRYRGKPRIDFKSLEQYHDGLICSSACMAGEVCRALMDKQVFKAKTIAMKYKNLFKDDYYLEYQSHNNEEQLSLNKQIVDMGKELDIKCIVTCDAHYLNKEDQKYHNVFVQIGTTREVGETYNDCYVQNEHEIYDKCSTTTDYNVIAIANTQEISDKCNAEFPLAAPIIPHVDIPTGYQTEVAYLKHLCNDGYVKKGFNLLPKDRQLEYKNRAKYEMNAIDKMGFAGYYLLVHSYIAAAKRRGIARGSGGGSLIAYLSGIVDIDPIIFGLYFERFIDVGALELLESGKITRKQLKIPDFDTDFSPNDREKVLQFITDKYGKDNVVSIGQFSYIWAKSAIKDIGKVLDIPFSVTNEMTKQLDSETIEEALDLGLLDSYKDEYPQLFEYASRLSGLPKSFGVHPCGKIIAMRNADYYNALEFSETKNVWVLQGDMHTADDLGLVKIDLLGLRTLDVMYDVLEMIGKEYNYIAPHKINLNDENVWNEFAQGNSSLIFQFESLGMKQMLKEMKCNSMENLSAANALYRPGSKQYIPNYISRKNGFEEIQYLNYELEPILANSYGIIVFQEQLIEIGRLAGLKNPDQLRQATAKKKPKLMAIIEPEMKQGLLKRGWTEQQVNKLWDDILKFAKYSFNKSHSSAYALTAYICMFLKHYHTVEYITASINSYDGDTDKIAEVIQEAVRMNVSFKFDKWECIQAKTTCRDNTVFLGINTLKGFGGSVTTALNEVANLNCDNFLDLIIAFDNNTNMDKSQLETLITLNMFSEYGENGKLLKIYDLYQKIYTRKTFSKDKLPVSEDIIKKYADETAKQYKNIRTAELFAELCKCIDNKSISLTKQLKKAFEVQGYINYVNSKLEYFVFVIKVDTKYSPKIRVYHLDTGTCETMKTNARIYQQDPIMVGDILQITGSEQRGKSKMVDGKWQKSLEEFETWIKSYIKR